MLRGAEKMDLLTTPDHERSEQNKPAHCATIADVLAVAKPRGLMLCLGRHAEHRAIVLMSCPCEASRAIACLDRGEASRLLLCLGRYAEHRALLLCLGRAKTRALFWSGSGGSLVEL